MLLEDGQKMMFISCIVLFSGEVLHLCNQHIPQLQMYCLKCLNRIPSDRVLWYRADALLPTNSHLLVVAAFESPVPDSRDLGFWVLALMPVNQPDYVGQIIQYELFIHTPPSWPSCPLSGIAVHFGLSPNILLAKLWLLNKYICCVDGWKDRWPGVDESYKFWSSVCTFRNQGHQFKLSESPSISNHLWLCFLLKSQAEFFQSCLELAHVKPVNVVVKP